MATTGFWPVRSSLGAVIAYADNPDKTTNPKYLDDDLTQVLRYKVLDNEEMDALTESIREHGVMSSLIVRPLEGTTDEYEVISGHRRLHAAQKAGMDTVTLRSK
ncbi:MAG: ParB N-terminal domain-containing protein [Oscillospiraceae bacterium]|nr:ParB N-terminal domain-containing protein [Oscillospiraceae bacterium]